MQKVVFLEKKKIAQNTWQFIFAKPSGFAFTAGQYTTIFLGKENRDFTICAKEDDKELFSIVTKPGVSEFKKKLLSLPEKAQVVMNKPSGGFILSEAVTPKVFLAGGIGMTVFYSIIASNIKTKIPFTLLVSFSKKEDIIFYDELQEIQKRNKNIKVIYTLSQEIHGHPALDAGSRDKILKQVQDDNYDTGRISESFIRKYVSNFKNTEFMIAGGEKMVEDTEDLLLKMKIPQENIRVDIFTGYK